VATSSASAPCCRGHSSNTRFRYERRKPEDSVLYRVIRENLETFLAYTHQSEVGRGFPAFVEKELRGYLDCGILSGKGFARFKCVDCGREKLAAFSCKGRGFCPSCGGRRMTALSAHLVDRVIPIFSNQLSAISGQQERGLPIDDLNLLGKDDYERLGTQVEEVKRMLAGLLEKLKADR
jgi:DNA-directed RNA polymerase subunit RPC12/RpoP